jgi:hypothetical protein
MGDNGVCGRGERGEDGELDDSVLKASLGVQAPRQNWSPCSPYPPGRRLGAA